MDFAGVATDKTSLRRYDVNSLLRLFDHFSSARNGAATPAERLSAERSHGRIAGELRRRGTHP